ncbi:MAG: ATP-binding cassette domain-containing protein [Cellulomonadaceae bacterium]|nr:ATP-binding cassette domain-containing protein [Cellulomonadaceae bacterium]
MRPATLGPQATDTAVRLTGLGHRFPGTHMLFAGLNAVLHPGEVVGLVGPSGSGKSTLLSIIAGWVDPACGTVDRQGIQHTGWVFQNPHGVARRTALDHVVLPLLGQGYARRDAEGRARQVLARFSLANVSDRQFRALSGGEAQRLMLARAVATGSDLLLVDEPTAQLDLATATTVNAVLAESAQDQAIVVIATHDAHTRDACTRVIDLADFQTAPETALTTAPASSPESVEPPSPSRRVTP